MRATTACLIAQLSRNVQYQIDVLPLPDHFLNEEEEEEEDDDDTTITDEE
jgi:hypothetical protein